MKKILTFKRNNDKLNVLTNMDNIRPIWKIYDQFGQFKSNKGQYVKWIIHLGQSMQNHGEMIGVQALYLDKF